MASLRARLAALVALVSFVVLAGAGWGVVVVVQHWLHDAVRDEARRAVEMAALNVTVGVPIGAGGPGEPAVRLVRGDASREARPHEGGPDAFSVDLPQVADGEVEIVRRRVGGVDAYVAVSAGRDEEGNRFVLLSAAPLDEAERTLTALRRATIGAVPTLALLLAGLAALVAGRVLRPVAVMRAEADDISHGTLHRRLTPATRSSELAALAATMNDMLDRLERSATGQRRLVSDVSHELRSPLATIRAELELAGHGDGDGLAVALAEVDRLEDVVSGLLTLSRLDEAGPGRTEDLDLEDVVAAQVVAVARPGITIDASAVAPARIHADRRAVVGLVRNLLDNAVRHATAAVRVAVAEHDDGVELTVEDDGPGIPPEHRQRVFERFARLDEGRSRDAGGAGLGLAVAAAATRAQGGRITVEDGTAGGARLRAVLPARPVRPSP